MLNHNYSRRQESSVNALQCPVQISLDVHENSTRIYCIDLTTGEIKKDANIQGHYKNTFKHIQGLGKPNNTMIIYEAGCHGFSPYRFFTKKGYITKVIAPSSIPKRQNDQKTDRDDAIHNLYYHTSNLLRYVGVPRESDEDVRESLRFRQQKMWELCQEKQKIQSLVKRWGLKFTATKTYWTKAHYHWLHTVSLGPGTRKVLDCRLSKLQELKDQIIDLDRVLDTFMAENPNHDFMMKMYQTIVGIGRIGAMVLILEGCDLCRFNHPKAFMKYTGLIPGKCSSGSRDPSLHITKQGNKYIRTALIGAAKYYGDTRLLFSQKKKKKVPNELISFNDRCKKRLCARYHALRMKGKHTNVVRTAIARELCGFIWSLCNEELPLINKEELCWVA
jgi:transposase